MDAPAALGAAFRILRRPLKILSASMEGTMVWGGRLGGTVATIVTDRLRGDGTMIVLILVVVDSPGDAVADDR